MAVTRPDRPVRIGAHFATPDVIATAQAAGAQAAQIFLADPQKWKIGSIDYSGGSAGLKADAEAADIDLYVHAPYLINLASANNRVRIPSRKLLQATAAGAEKIGAKGVIVHGGHVGAEDDVVEGFIAWRKAFDALETDVPILIENTAGGSGAMARTLDRIGMLWQAIQTSPNAHLAGFTLDTCHAWAAGLDLATVVDDITAITGRIDLVHANDSKGDAGSNLDRHTNFGEGTIPEDLLLGVIRAADAPVICETHGDLKQDIAWLRARL